MQASPLEQFLETDGARLRYRDEGRGPAVLLVHGWTLDLDMWGVQAEALADRFRIVRLDRRGHGLSSGHPDTARDSDDLRALCEHLGLDCVALVGMSQGARAVLQFAEYFPQLAACIVLDGPPHIGPENPASARDVPHSYYGELARTQGLAAFRREWGQHGLTQLKTADPQTRALLARMLDRYPGRDLMELAAPSAGPPADSHAESVNCPVLVVSGELDLASRRQYARLLASRFSRVECAEIPGAGHLCNLDNPSVYNQFLRRFLERYAVCSVTY